MDQPDDASPLNYAAPDTPRATRHPRPRGWSERLAESLFLWLLASPFIYGGNCCWTSAAGMVPGYGERANLNRNGWALIAAGGTFVCVGPNGLRRRTR